MAADHPEKVTKVGEGVFATTHWSVVLAAGQTATPEAQEALERLCRTYWYPLYACVRREGHSAEDAKDLTQEFIARFIEKKYLKLADRDRGRFRSFLLTSLKHFIINEWRKHQTAKRGGGAVPISIDEEDAEGRYTTELVSPEMPPDKLFERRWALALLDQVLVRLRQEYSEAGKTALFNELKAFVWGEKSALPQAEIAARLGLTENAVSVAVFRLRRRYGELLRAEIANTVALASDIDDELRHLLGAISG